MHLKVRDMALQKSSEHDIFAGPRRATVLPVSTSGWRRRRGDFRHVINAQNCVHCKTCDIKDPNQNINWVLRRAARGRFIRICEDERASAAPCDQAGAFGRIVALVASALYDDAAWRNGCEKHLTTS